MYVYSQRERERERERERRRRERESRRSVKRASVGAQNAQDVSPDLATSVASSSPHASSVSVTTCVRRTM